jgi:cytochrome c oxidase cbb3-type subunit III
MRRSLLASIFLAIVLQPAKGSPDEEPAAAIFRDVCSVCHGAGGRGDGPSAQGLEPKPADFTDCKALAKDSDEVLFKIIKSGGQSAGRSTVMPSWGDSLSEQQIRGLVQLIRGFCKK